MVLQLFQQFTGMNVIVSINKYMDQCMVGWIDKGG